MRVQLLLTRNLNPRGFVVSAINSTCARCNEETTTGAEVRGESVNELTKSVDQEDGNLRVAGKSPKRPQRILVGEREHVSKSRRVG
jgi:hypothetical protein